MSDTGATQLAKAIEAVCKRCGPVRVMEVCGTHTVSLFRGGVRSMLPPDLKLVSGPGCPVCVSSQGYIDAACALASKPDVTVCTYGDMMRVPGRLGSLQDRKAQGGQVRVVYSPLDAVKLAAADSGTEVVFLAVGFETTAPGHAAAVIEAKRLGLKNFSLLTAQKLVIPAMRALLDVGDVPIDGFLCPGHVSVIIGAGAYQPIADHYRKPCVVAGFEPVQMLQGLLRIVEMVEAAEAGVENVYEVAVSTSGNDIAVRLLDEVFTAGDEVWRAMGVIPRSGLSLRDAYRDFDALARFDLQVGPDYEPPGCRCGEVIQGKLDPKNCALFAHTCTPTTPVGPCMVSSEGTCAAAFKYDRPGIGNAHGRVEREPC